jgi:hypothetical protein
VGSLHGYDSSKREGKAIIVSHEFFFHLLSCFRIDWERALQYHSETLLQKHWLLLIGYVTNLRKERYRLEYRRSSLAVAHYKYHMSFFYSLTDCLSVCLSLSRRKLLMTLWKKWKSYRKILRAKATAVTRQILRSSFPLSLSLS